MNHSPSSQITQLIRSVSTCKWSAAHGSWTIQISVRISFQPISRRKKNTHLTFRWYLLNVVHHYRFKPCNSPIKIDQQQQWTKVTKNMLKPLIRCGYLKCTMYRPYNREECSLSIVPPAFEETISFIWRRERERKNTFYLKLVFSLRISNINSREKGKNIIS